MHINEAPISHLQRTARISVVTQASRMKLFTTISNEPVYFGFSRTAFHCGNFPLGPRSLNEKLRFSNPDSENKYSDSLRKFCVIMDVLTYVRSITMLMAVE